MTDHNFVSLVNIEKLDRTGGFLFSITRNRAIDHCGPHLDFLTAEPDKGLLISCHVEVAGEDSVAGALESCKFACSVTSAPCWRRRSTSSSSASLVSAHTSIRAKLWSARFSPIL